MAERKIADRTYRVHPMPAGAAIELYADIMRVVTGGTGRVPVIMAAIAEGETGMAEAAALASLGDVLQKNSSSDLRALVERIATQAEVNRPGGYGAIHFDEEFEGRLGTIVPVLKFVLEVNFADFFPANVGSGLLSGLRAALATQRSAA